MRSQPQRRWLAAILTVFALLTAADGAHAQTLSGTNTTLDATNGVLVLSFGSGIDKSSVDPTKIHIREEGVTTGGVTLSTAENTANSETSSTTVRFTLTSANLAIVREFRNPRLQFDLGALTTTSGTTPPSAPFPRVFDVRDAEYTGSSFDPGIFPVGISFNSAGTRMFLTETSTDSVHRFTLGTAFDISTATVTGKQAYSIGSETPGNNTAPQEAVFNSNGTRMFVLDGGFRRISEYALSTAYHLTSASYVDRFTLGQLDQVTIPERTPTGIAFNSDGTRLFTTGTNSDRVNEYPISTAYDLSTTSLANMGDIIRSFNFGSATNPLDITFNADGTRIYALSGSADTVTQYDLATAYTTVGANTGGDGSVLIRDDQTNPRGFAFSTGGDRLFVAGNGPQAVLEYNLNPQRMFTVNNLGPTVVSISGVDGFYREGEVIPITVTFTETVTVTGTPALALVFSGANGSATYTSGSGTTALTFTHTVAADTNVLDLNYGTTTSLTLPGGATIQSAANPTVVAILTLPALTSGNSLGGGSAIVIDTITPRIESATTSIDGTRVILVADETLVTNSLLASEYRLAGTAAKVTTITHSDRTLTLTVSPSILITDIITLARAASPTITDQAGNQLMAAVTLSVTNAIPSTPTVLSVLGEDGSYKVGTEVPITITFSEAVTVSGTPQLELSTATGGSTGVATYTAGSVSDVLIFTYSVVDADETSYLTYTGTDALSGTIQNAAATIDADLTLPAVDSATSLSGTSAIVLDTTVPVFPGTATTITDPLVRTITIGSTTTTVVYDAEATDRGRTADTGIRYTLRGANASIFTIDPDNGVLTPMANIISETTYNVIITATDELNHISAEFHLRVIVVDLPVVTISDNIAADTPATRLTDTATSADGALTFTFGWSEEVTGFTAEDISVTGGSKGDFNTVTANLTYTLTVTPLADTNDGVLTIAVAADVVTAVATDVVGNARNNAASLPYTQDYDTKAPAAPSIDAVAGDNLIDAVERDAGVIVTGMIVTGMNEADVRVTLFANATTNTAMTYTPVTVSDMTWSVTLSTAEIKAFTTNIVTPDRDRHQCGRQHLRFLRPVGTSAWPSPFPQWQHRKQRQLRCPTAKSAMLRCRVPATCW